MLTTRASPVNTRTGSDVRLLLDDLGLRYLIDTHTQDSPRRRSDFHRLGDAIADNPADATIVVHEQRHFVALAHGNLLVHENIVEFLRPVQTDGLVAIAFTPVANSHGVTEFLEVEIF